MIWVTNFFFFNQKNLDLRKFDLKNSGPKKSRLKRDWIKQILLKKNWVKIIRAIKKLGTKSLVKIGSVIAELFLVWTNVAKTNVAGTNATLTDGLCSRCSQKPIFKVSSKFGQLELRYS